MKRSGLLAASSLAMLIPTMVAAQSTQSGQSQTQTQTQTPTTQSGQTTTTPTTTTGGTTTSGTTTTGDQTTTGGTQTGTTQTGGMQTGGTQTGTTTSGRDQTTTGGTQTSQGMGGTRWMDRVESHWVGSGFLGSNFGTDAEEAGFDFGGSIGYLWSGALGAEFQANFSPEFELDAARSAVLFGEQPWINTFMFNGVLAAPMGSEGSWQPYVSGGFGMLSLRSETLQSTTTTTTTTGGASTSTTVGNQISGDDSRGAGNIGVGFMGYRGNVGFRADVRYFRGFEAGNDNDTTGDDAGDALGRLILSDLTFWRANIGLAFKW